MRKRTSRHGVNEMADAMVEAIANGDILRTSDGKNLIAVAMGRRGGLKGGPARAAKMSKKERSDSARRAAQARWSTRG